MSSNIRAHQSKVEASRSTASDTHLGSEDEGYKKTLRLRQVQMIAIGGAIGSGLFMGAGARLAAAGPSLVLVYTMCGFFAWLIVRAMGELVPIGLDYPVGTFTIASVPFYGAVLAVGWYLVRDRVKAIASGEMTVSGQAEQRECGGQALASNE